MVRRDIAALGLFPHIANADSSTGGTVRAQRHWLRLAQLRCMMPVPTPVLPG
ncbi:hypothetical protein [Desulfovibrio sp. 86]|uniref:hypothetical protein n=1 Tax=Desulfovibrio sp. 86 TaxID=2666132 RepID=UPI0015D22381|nr:hypothetical protein [Desulfovibrio sp. 86]